MRRGTDKKPAFGEADEPGLSLSPGAEAWGIPDSLSLHTRKELRRRLRNKTLENAVRMRYDGGCLCGQTRFRINAPPRDSGYCHCRMCQRNSGAPVVAWVTISSTNFSWISGKPRAYVSSVHAVREFCRTCGSCLVLRSTLYSDVLSINTATFDDPNVFPPRKHIFVENRLVWFQTADDLPCHQEYG